LVTTRIPWRPSRARSAMSTSGSSARTFSTKRHSTSSNRRATRKSRLPRGYFWHSTSGNRRATRKSRLPRGHFIASCATPHYCVFNGTSFVVLGLSGSKPNLHLEFLTDYRYLRNLKVPLGLRRRPLHYAGLECFNPAPSTSKLVLFYIISPRGLALDASLLIVSATQLYHTGD